MVTSGASVASGADPANLTLLMQSHAATVKEYLAELPGDRRAIIEAVRAVIRRNLDPTYEEGMQYGMIGYFVPHSVYPPGYHCNPQEPLPFVDLASQKNYFSLYLGCIYGDHELATWFRDAWAKTGRKLNAGKSCIRFRKLEDLALDVIGEAIRRMPARKFIAHYESVLKESRRRLVTEAKGKRKTKSASAKRRK